MTIFYNQVLNDEERARLVSNIAGHLKDAKDFIQKRAVSTVLFFFVCHLIKRMLQPLGHILQPTKWLVNASLCNWGVHSCRIKFLDHIWFHSQFLASQQSISCILILNKRSALINFKSSVNYCKLG